MTAKGRSRPVWLREKGESFEFPAETKPLLVRFDEGNVLIKEIAFPKDLDELLFQLKSDDVIGRMAAAGELASMQDQALTVPALPERPGRPFWAVRRAALESLARGRARAEAALKQACRDADSSVRTAAVLALGASRKGAGRFFKELFRTDASVRVRAEALRSLGKTGDKALVPFLKQAAETPSRQNLIKRAAEAALKQLEK